MVKTFKSYHAKLIDSGLGYRGFELPQERILALKTTSVLAGIDLKEEESLGWVTELISTCNDIELSDYLKNEITSLKGLRERQRRRLSLQKLVERNSLVIQSKADTMNSKSRHSKRKLGFDCVDISPSTSNQIVVVGFPGTGTCDEDRNRRRLLSFGRDYFLEIDQIYHTSDSGCVTPRLSDITKGVLILKQIDEKFPFDIESLINRGAPLCEIEELAKKSLQRLLSEHFSEEQQVEFFKSEGLFRRFGYDGNIASLIEVLKKKSEEIFKLKKSSKKQSEKKDNSLWEQPYGAAAGRARQSSDSAGLLKSDRKAETEDRDKSLGSGGNLDRNRGQIKAKKQQPGIKNIRLDVLKRRSIQMNRVGSSCINDHDSGVLSIKRRSSHSATNSNDSRLQVPQSSQLKKRKKVARNGFQDLKIELGPCRSHFLTSPRMDDHKILHSFSSRSSGKLAKVQVEQNYLILQAYYKKEEETYNEKRGLLGAMIQEIKQSRKLANLSNKQQSNLYELLDNEVYDIIECLKQFKQGTQIKELYCILKTLSEVDATVEGSVLSPQLRGSTGKAQFYSFKSLLMFLRDEQHLISKEEFDFYLEMFMKQDEALVGSHECLRKSGKPFCNRRKNKNEVLLDFFAQFHDTFLFEEDVNSFLDDLKDFLETLKLIKKIYHKHKSRKSSILRRIEEFNHVKKRQMSILRNFKKFLSDDIYKLAELVRIHPK